MAQGPTMDFSLWYLLTLLPAAIGLVCVVVTRNEQVIGRLEFLVRLFAYCAFGIALAFVLRLRDENIASAIMALYLLSGCYMIPYWAIARLRDMGVHNKYWAVLTTLPVVGVICMIYLLCAKSAAELAPKAEEDLPPIVPQEVLDAIEAEKAGHASGTIS